MEFKDVAAITGKSGLFKVLKPTRTGVILESIDAAKNKLIIDSNTKVSILKDITIYTTGSDNALVTDILYKIKETFDIQLPVTNKSSDKELKEFLLQILPEYDTEKVYASDIKKIVNWYTIILANYPELLTKTILEDAVEAPLEENSKVAEKKAPSVAKKTTNAVKDVKAKQATTKTSAPPKKISTPRKAS